jgi:hypothetical protein
MNWINVKERLPIECESVLIWKKGMIPISASLFCTKQGKAICYLVENWDESDQTISLEGVTHWMQIPETPNE